jgi:hypothetical protein
VNFLFTKGGYMPDYNIHIAIGNCYIKKYKINNKLAFYNGLVEPDLKEPKTVSHYSGIQDKNNLFNHLENKVLLNNFLEKNNIENDYKKGEFLHLLTDYLFFNSYFNKDYLSKIPYDKFCKDLYYSYDFTNDYVDKKYKVAFIVHKDEIEKKIANSRKRVNMDNKEYTNLLNYDELDNFIEKVSSIDLDKYAQKIKDLGKNTLPDNY